MNLKDEFISHQSKQNGKITFAVNEYGHVTHIVKRVDLRLYDVFLRLQKIRCVNLPVIIDLVKQADHLEVHEEYVRGRTVEQARQEKGTLDASVLLSVAMDVCRALIAIHGTEPPIIHRDIKPDNIMERENGGYVLIDFDAARLYREDAETDTKCIATVGYAAPEQYGLSQTDVRSDLFSLGVTLYELMTGEAYYMGAQCGGRLGKVIAKCTAFEPKRRFQSAKQLLRRLEALQPDNKHSTDKARICIAILSCTTIIAALCAVYFGAIRKDAPEKTPSAAIEASAMNVSDIFEAQSDTCTCSFAAKELSTDQGSIVALDPEVPVTVQLQVNGSFDRTACTAKSHTETVGLTACAIDKSTLGAKAEITDQGSMTIHTPGAYYVSGFMMIDGKAGDYITALIVATENPQAYTECKCVIESGDSTPGLCFKDITSCQLPVVGDFRCELYAEPHLIDRVCTASEHMDVFVFPGYVESAPDGAHCGVTPDNWFYTDTAGHYEIFVDVCFNGGLSRYGSGLTVDPGE